MNRLLLLSVIATGLLLVVVVYLIRTRRLHERFALIWLAGATGIAVLAVWGSALNAIADWAGIAYPPNVLFVVGGGFVLWVLLHSAVVMTRVVKQNTQLAQRVAMLETEIDDLKKTSGQDGDMSATRESVARP